MLRSFVTVSRSGRIGVHSVSEEWRRWYHANSVQLKPSTDSRELT